MHLFVLFCSVLRFFGFLLVFWQAWWWIDWLIQFTLVVDSFDKTAVLCMVGGEYVGVKLPFWVYLHNTECKWQLVVEAENAKWWRKSRGSVSFIYLTANMHGRGNVRRHLNRRWQDRRPRWQDTDPRCQRFARFHLQCTSIVRYFARRLARSKSSKVTSCFPPPRLARLTVCRWDVVT